MSRTAQPSEFVHAITVAIAMTFLGEMVIFLLWGLVLFPARELVAKFLWTGICGIAMGAVIGAAVNVFVTGRHEGRPAAGFAALISFSVLSFCTVLCYRLDLTFGLFGAKTDPVLFIAGGLLPALVGSGLYGWVLYSRTGRTLLARLDY